jgi:DNA-binding NarL/FixJ family response regulator
MRRAAVRRCLVARRRDRVGMSDKAIRVVLADDHQLVRTGFRVILELEDDIEVVGEASDGRQAVDLVGIVAPDVVLMDVEMPGMDGLEATRQITASHGPAVLILTTFDRDEYLFAALQAGASGFLLKNGTPEALTEAVRVLARGDALLAPEITSRVIAAFARPGGVAGGGAVGPDVRRLAELTPREHEVLVALARGATNAEIAVALQLGETTVKTHVSRVLMKLGARDRTQAVVFAYELGVVRPGPPQGGPG